MEKLSKILKERRAALGLTLAQVADLVGVSEATVQRWESGEIKSLRYGRIQKLADVLQVSPGSFMDWSEPAAIDTPALTEAGERIGALYDVAGDRDKRIVETVLSPYEPQLAPRKGKRLPPRRNRRRDGMDEISVYDQPAAAGLGNYLDTPSTRLEQYPAGYIPDGAAFGVVISGDSMEPEIRDGSTAFVQPAPAVADGEIGVFVLNGQAYCKRLIVDTAGRRVLLRSANPDYADIIVSALDELRTIGRVLGSYPR